MSPVHVRRAALFAALLGVLVALVGMEVGAQPPDTNREAVGETGPGAPPVPPGALRLINFTWHKGRVAICAEEPGPPVERGARLTPRTRVWVRDATATRQIATGAGTCDPAWAPEGDRLAVVAPDGLWVISADLRQTSHLVDTRHSETPANEFDHRTLAGPLWAPNASAVAVLVSNGATGWVEVFDVRTGQTLYSSEPETYEFSWSADSRSLRFGSRVVRLP